jgi:Leucine-rich repeat (LRR) protein
VAKRCPSLTSINLSYTGALPAALIPLLQFRRETLQVLKLAIPGWVSFHFHRSPGNSDTTHQTDAAFAKLDTLRDEGFILPALQTLKLRQTNLSDISLNALLPLCPNIRRLDLSFTRVRQLSDTVLDQFGGLEKLVLTSTEITNKELHNILLHVPRLSTLNIGALGSGQARSSSSGLGNATALTLTDDVLTSVTKILRTNSHLTSVNLVGNSKLGQRRKPISDFIEVIGRRLKVCSLLPCIVHCSLRWHSQNLNLTGLTALRSSDLSPLLSEDTSAGPPLLEVLSLNRTALGDDSAPYIAACKSLQVLEVAATRFSGTPFFPWLFFMRTHYILRGWVIQYH